MCNVHRIYDLIDAYQIKHVWRDLETQRDKSVSKRAGSHAREQRMTELKANMLPHTAQI